MTESPTATVAESPVADQRTRIDQQIVEIVSDSGEGQRLEGIQATVRRGDQGNYLQRCPTYTAGVYEELRRDPGRILLLGHERGVPIDPAVAKIYHHRREHDPSDLAGARALAERCERVAIGLFFHDPTAPCYEEFTTRGMEMTADEKLGALDRELDCFAI